MSKSRRSRVVDTDRIVELGLHTIRCVVYSAFKSNSCFSRIFISLPHCSSTLVCKGKPFITRLANNPNPPNAVKNNHKTLNEPAKATRTSVLRGSSRLEISGMREYASAVPSGIPAVKADGSRLRSSFCKIVPPTVIPQTYIHGSTVKRY